MAGKALCRYAFAPLRHYAISSLTNYSPPRLAHAIPRYSCIAAPILSILPIEGNHENGLSVTVGILFMLIMALRLYGVEALRFASHLCVAVASAEAQADRREAKAGLCGVKKSY